MKILKSKRTKNITKHLTNHLASSKKPQKTSKTSKTQKHGNHGNLEELCKFEYSGTDIEDEKTIIVSASLFKLNDMYKDISRYTDGLYGIIEYMDKLNKNIESSNNTKLHKLHLFLYYDHSVENDTGFLKIKNELIPSKNCVKLCKYFCPTFMENNLHRGLFGTFVRFYPLFDKSLSKYMKTITDIDDFNRNMEIKYHFNCIQKVYNTKHKFVLFHSIGYEATYNNLYKNEYIDGTSLANIILNKTHLPFKLLENFLIRLRNNDSEIVAIVKKLHELKNAYVSNINYKNFNLFAYGIDELFVNKFLLNYVIKTYRKIGIIYTFLPIKNIINWTESNPLTIIKLLKEYLGNEYIEDKLDKNINLIMNKISMINIREINAYNTKIKNLHKFYLLILKFIKNPDNGLIVNNLCLQHLEKGFRTHNQILRFVLTSKHSSALFKYLSNKMEIYTLSLSDISK